jgi:hypothetical protein
MGIAISPPMTRRPKNVSAQGFRDFAGADSGMVWAAITRPPGSIFHSRFEKSSAHLAVSNHHDPLPGSTPGQ